jgi:mono/diheme cytochrome c family protein
MARAMKPLKNCPHILAWAAVVWAVCAFSAVTSRAQSAAPAAGGPGIWSGVYTEAQARRGEAAGGSCTGCHGSGLVNGRAPALSGPDFLKNWGGRSVGVLFDKIHKTMPRNAPGTLSVQDAADIIAHILQLSKVPAGAKELPTDMDALNQIAIGEPSAVQNIMADSAIWIGVYTDAQAKRGEGAADSKKCTVCHGDNMTGDVGPSLVGDEFLTNWNQKSLGDLFDLIHKTMPDNMPGTLSSQETADLIARLLQLNKVPAGEKEVPTDMDVLGHIKISSQPPAK